MVFGSSGCKWKPGSSHAHHKFNLWCHDSAVWHGWPFSWSGTSLARLPYENGLANKFSSAKLTLTYPAQNYDSHSFMAGKVQKQQETATDQAGDEYRPKAESAVSASRFPWLYLPRLAELREISLPASRPELFTCFRSAPEGSAMGHSLVKPSLIYKLDFRCSG